MTTTSETPGFAEHLDAAALAAAAFEPEHESPAPAPGKPSSRKSVLALSVCALAINGAAAIYTLPFDLPSPNIGSLAALLPRQQESVAKPDPIVAALKDIQSAQQQQAAALQEINSALQQNAVLQQQDSTVLVSLRQSITDERGDVKKISPQLSTLIAKIDSLQSTMTSDVTSSIRKAHARYGLSPAMRKRMMDRQSKSIGPISVGGAPLTAPVTVAAPES
ncbi:putative coiled-coil protein SlyX [Bradyrhizobium sp. LB11.1]